MSGPMDRRATGGDEDTRLLAYQINEMRTSNDQFQLDVVRGIERIERKMDSNMEQMTARHENLEGRVIDLERDREANSRAASAIAKREEKSTLSWQVWVGIVCGVLGLGLAWLTLIAIVLIAVL